MTKKGQPVQPTRPTATSAAHRLQQAKVVAQGIPQTHLSKGLGPAKIDTKSGTIHR